MYIWSSNIEKQHSNWTTFKNSFDSKNNPNKKSEKYENGRFNFPNMFVTIVTSNSVRKEKRAPPARDTQPRLKCFNGKKERVSTPRKINMEHNHRGLEDHFPF